MNKPVLQLKNISRLFPRDVSETGSSLYREMIFPKSMIKSNNIDYFHAIKDINISLNKNEKIGVLGTHLCGKSTLAAIASGMIEPTSGTVSFYGTRQLISGRASAGYKPMLKVIENLKLQAMFLGFYGENLKIAMDNAVMKSKLSYSDVTQTTGNVSQHIIRQLALMLSLEVKSEILIIDNVSSIGVGPVRKDIEMYIKNRILASTSIIIASNPKLIEGITDKVFVLHFGKLYGPFRLAEAVSHYVELPSDDEESSYGNLPPKRRNNRRDVNIHDIQGSEEDDEIELSDPWVEKFALKQTKINEKESSRKIKSSNREEKYKKRGKLDKYIKKSKENSIPVIEVTDVLVDNDQYYYRYSSLIRNKFDSLNIRLGLNIINDISISEFIITLHPEFEDELIKKTISIENIFLKKGSECSLNFDIQIPDLKPYRYLIAITPVESNKQFLIKNRIKFIKFAILGHGIMVNHIDMKLKLNSFEK